VHQQDVAWGLANRMLAPFASHRTCAFEETCQRLTSTSAISVGNPVRRSILLGDPTVGRAELGLDANRPLVLATGGGTGAARLNDLLVGAAPELLKCCQIVHLVGAGKAVRFAAPGYHQLEFVTDLMPHLLAAADVVLSRAGMSSLSELAALRKPAIVVPMPGSHQEANGAAFGRAGAALVLAEAALTAEGLCDAVLLLLEDRSARDRLGAAAARVLPFDAAGRIADSLLRLAGY
jgi:UDP-N-acetylglucosamine--N-acetylmuramyl-(pentapeptide) pyrophosphoryl-undecaprenol N-acetylglucosamine transferase